MKKVRDGVVAAVSAAKFLGCLRLSRVALRLGHRSFPCARLLLRFEKLSRYPHSFAATLAALPSISEVPFPRFAFGFAAFDFLVGHRFRGLKLSRCPHSFAATLAALPSISEIPFPRFAFGFAAVFFLVPRCFRDFAAAGCASDVEAAFFFRRASRCLRASLSRK